MPLSVALLSSGIRASQMKRVSRSQLATTYAAALPMDSVLSVACVQSQVFIVAITAALSLRRRSALMTRSPLGARIDLVKLPDPLEREVGLGVIGRGLLELAEHVRPAA